MRYRRLDDNGDYQLGHGKNDYLTDTPETVIQAVITRLKLWLEEWFLNSDDGTPWASLVLGKYTVAEYDDAIRARILGTQGVIKLIDYESVLDRESRALSISAEISTVYGVGALQGVNIWTNP